VDSRAGDSVAGDEKANVQLCPACKTQAAMDPRKRGKTLRCPLCKMRFPALRYDGTSRCSHCGRPITVPGWVVGQVVLCPDCEGGLRLKWDYEP
jgi:predicted RNA-binding Zn-ribbon protein involved in translation (DUF1610 family)